RWRLFSFLKSEDGAATVEFVVVFLGFIALITFVLEVTLYLFFLASLQKAAEAGVRMAVASPPTVTGIPTTIPKTFDGRYGEKCSSNDAPCVPFFTRTCTGGGCQAAPFNRILAHMRGFNGQINASNVTITYTDVGIGFAGGPTVPMVTVTVSN